jgi:uncharacterized protein YcaQ
MPITLDDLRRFAVNHSLFTPTTLKRALDKLAFVQADPIRAPARAQDLILRHRVRNYRAGDLERRYEKLGVHEDVFVNYGFVTSSLQSFMHPRTNTSRRSVPARQIRLVLDFVLERGPVHPREVEAHFSHGKVTNYWGGSSNATTQLLETMHYRGLLRVVRREAGIRIYAAHQHPHFDNAVERDRRIDALADAAVNIYAPLYGGGLSFLLRRLRYAVPQWQGDLSAAIKRARERLAHTRIDGVDWYWPADAKITRQRTPNLVRFLAPFDPVVWDRDRFELLWGWEYRFEAYTPAPKRQRGYYALPMLWRDQVIGWANLSIQNGDLKSDLGYIGSPPNDRAFQRELEAELDRIRTFVQKPAEIKP